MTNQKSIPQMEPWYGEEEKQAVRKYLNSGGWIMEFKKTKELEEMIAELVGSKYCVMLPNGTLTLWVALAVLGVGSGDEVIVPDYTMVATPNAVKLAGSEPVFVDINKETLCLDPDLVEAAITDRTKAIMLVTINGRAPDMERFTEIAKRHNLYLIEDAAQSFGSTYKGKALGTFGDFGSYSFSMPKVITMGQGGALVTNNEELYKKLLKFKDFGRPHGGSDDYEILGYNLKFTDLQAVFGIEQMKKMDFRLRRKKEIYKKYEEQLKQIKEVELIPTNLEETSPWFIDVLVDDPDSLAACLKENQIGSRRFYPTLHNLSFYNKKGNFPVAEKVSAKGLWLPSSSGLLDGNISHVCKTILKYFTNKKS